MVHQNYQDGQIIINEGELGYLFYIIVDGNVNCTKNGVELRNLTHGDYFGEQALLFNSKRTANIIANGPVNLMCISRDDLFNVLGDKIESIIYRNSQRIAIENDQILNHLQSFQIDKLIEISTVTSYSNGFTIIGPGIKLGYKLWILLKGTLLTSSNNKEIQIYSVIGVDDLMNPKEDEYSIKYISEGKVIMAEWTKDAIEACLGGNFQEIIEKNKIISILKKVELLRSLPNEKIRSISNLLSIEEYENKKVIFKQGESGDKFYIVKSGCVNIVKNNIVIRTIIQFDYFGERAIITRDSRTASVIAEGPTSCWVLSQDHFLNCVKDDLQNQLIKRMDLQNDTISFNDLYIVKMIGKGNYGNVYLTVHKKLRTLYALKTVSRNKIAFYDIAQNLKHERKVLLSIDHTLIMKLVKTFKDDSRISFLMEYIQGKDLQSVLKSLNFLTNNAIKFYACCILLMIEHLHERKIIYRDLKPENIIIDEQGYPKLIDFGTAAKVNGRAYTVIGTPYFMAPEVVLGRGYTMYADY